MFRRKDTESAVNSIYRLINLVDKAFGNHLDTNNENDLKVLRLRTLDEKLSKICKSNEMYQAVNKKLDLIRQSNKNPSISDYVEICQIEEECQERSQIAKLSLEVNQIEYEENVEEEVYDQNDVEPNNLEWNNDHMSNHNEHQNVDLHYDENDHPWDDEGCSQQSYDTYKDPRNEYYEKAQYDSRNRPKTRYHHASQEVRFQEDQSRTNETMCHNCNGAGYITIRGNECNELQSLNNCIEQISVPFHEDNDEIEEQFNDDDNQ